MKPAHSVNIGLKPQVFQAKPLNNNRLPPRVGQQPGINMKPPGMAPHQGFAPGCAPHQGFAPNPGMPPHPGFAPHGFAPHLGLAPQPGFEKQLGPHHGLAPHY